jgi:hypothetical protein
MKKPDLEVVFGKSPPPDEAEGKGDEAAPEQEDPEMDDALNSAIDDMFAAKDPEARREAFKTAVNMCKESSY